MPSMIMTEKGAEGRLCPVIGMSGANTALTAPQENMIRCRGSKCMAWRWREREPAVAEARTGYCGLAGEPENDY